MLTLTHFKNIALIVCIQYILILIPQNSCAQNRTKSSIDSIDLSIAYMEQGYYIKAISILSTLEKQDSNNIEIKYLLANSLLQGADRKIALEYIQNLNNYLLHSSQNKGKSYEASYLLLGKAYFYCYKFDEAQKIFLELKLRTKSNKYKAELNKLLKNIEQAEKFVNLPKEVKITPLYCINSEYYDHSPLVSADESIIFFTSRRANGVSGTEKASDSMYYEDIYSLDLNIGKTAKATSLGEPLNTFGHDATCSISMDGQEMLIFKSSEIDEGDIYYSRLNNKKWLTPIRLRAINSKYKESHAALSADRKAIYFSSNRPGGFGGSDIYVSHKKENGVFGNPKNLGKIINTKEDEEGPYMHADGKSLYFSSKGHITMGGFDVFVTELDEEGKWSKPENMGYPLNTIFDDVFLVPSVDGKTAYYSSVSNGVSNIFKAEIVNAKEKPLTVISGFAQNCKLDTFVFDKKDVLINEDTLTVNNKKWINNNKIFKEDKFIISHFYIEENTYTIIDSVCSSTPNANVTIFKLSDEGVADHSELNNKSGKYQFVLQAKEEYLVNYQAPGYMQKTQYINDTLDGFNHVKFNAELDTLDENTFDQRSIIFPVAEIKLTRRSAMEMEILAKFLKMNEHLYIDISGQMANDPLSENRGTSVSDLLIENGVPEDYIFKNLWNSNNGSDTLQITIFSSSYPEFQEVQKRKEIE
ncbi:MAG: PD40 domain-containing protein, partial [Bacteroidales bacterium]|nr:PD40 domain-containing protein [Bacteroidales bacterium]